MKIKQSPEDFIVDEITAIKPLDRGRYVYYRMKKRNYTVIRALQQISSRLNIPLKRIGFAGTKDKIAITTQYISFDSVDRQRIDRLNLKDIELEFYGYGDSPISLGDLIGNHFSIIARDVGIKPKALKKFINYFGKQRFSKNNVDVGRKIIKGNFSEAVRLISEVDDDFRERAESYLKKNQNDYIGILRTIPRKILMLYIHSYQSYIWNETVRQILEKGIDCESVPVVGFSTELEGDAGDIISHLLDIDSIGQRNFIIKSIPQLTSEGSERDIYAEVKDLKYEIKEKECKIEFKLQKGSYATVLLEQIFP